MVAKTRKGQPNNTRPLEEQWGIGQQQIVTASIDRGAIEVYRLKTGDLEITLYPWEVDELITALMLLRRRLRDMGIDP